jgi:hypothetical protein
MRVTNYYCDRCKDEVNKNALLISIGEGYPAIKYSMFRDETEICENCAKKFKELWSKFISNEKG